MHCCGAARKGLKAAAFAATQASPNFTPLVCVLPALQLSTATVKKMMKNKKQKKLLRKADTN